AVSGGNATDTLVAINLLNAAAGNVGKTVRFGPDSAYGRVTPYAEVVELARAMERGEVKLLLLGPGVNPAFTLPGGLKFADAIRKAGLVVSFASLPDETTALAGLVLPDTHWLESWGDYTPREGVTGLMQPTMAAARLGIVTGDALKVTSPHGALEVPAYVSPTLHGRAVAIPIGHRYAPYHVPHYVAAPSTPANPVALLSGAPEPSSGGPIYLGVRVTLAKTGVRRPLAILQATHDQQERELARHVDLRAAREAALSGRPEPEAPISLYPEKQYPGYRCGLATDVDACVGWQACGVP